MNWELFSTIGYFSVGLLLLVPVLWVLHLLIRPRRWLAHVALVVGVGAFALAKVNSSAYVARIQVDRSAQVEEQMSRQALARQAAENERAAEVADKRFAEDAAGDFLDLGGLDDSDRAYFDSLGNTDAPEWKKQKKDRGEGGAEADDPEALIGGVEDREGVEVAEEFEEQPKAEPILMSDKDKMLADRLDAANLQAGRLMLGLAALFVIFDYVRRLNVYREAYFPLPIPSAWADGLTPRQTIAKLPDKPRRAVIDELRHIARRGETFVYITDDADAAAKATIPMPRLPAGPARVEVIALGDDPMFDDGFVFETLWFGRHCFVIDDVNRAAGLLGHMLEQLAKRRASRAHTHRAVHVVWDCTSPISGSILQRFEVLGRATGFTLLICKSVSSSEQDA